MKPMETAVLSTASRLFWASWNFSVSSWMTLDHTLSELIPHPLKGTGRSSSTVQNLFRDLQKVHRSSDSPPVRSPQAVHRIRLSRDLSSKKGGSPVVLTSGGIHSYMLAAALAC